MSDTSRIASTNPSSTLTDGTSTLVTPSIDIANRHDSSAADRYDNTGMEDMEAGYTLPSVSWADPQTSKGYEQSSYKKFTGRNGRGRSKALSKLFEGYKYMDKEASYPGEENGDWIPEWTIREFLQTNPLIHPLYDLYGDPIQGGMSRPQLQEQYDAAVGKQKEIYSRSDLDHGRNHLKLNQFHFTHILRGVRSTINSPSYTGISNILDRANARREFDKCHLRGECLTSFDDKSITLTLTSYGLDDKNKNRRWTSITFKADGDLTYGYSDEVRGEEKKEESVD
ncbi:uncharacterized protein L199_000059 [Kwoniella botswanensis]|uniref:uncharacterized protein n=1 Tax=Kwoniella botswanensis TaxID=1268659 RepID=UPI00315D194F